MKNPTPVISILKLYPSMKRIEQVHVSIKEKRIYITFF